MILISLLIIEHFLIFALFLNYPPIIFLHYAFYQLNLLKASIFHVKAILITKILLLYITFAYSPPCKQFYLKELF
jgi:hypothetical protein